jgi:hypothetical protein
VIKPVNAWACAKASGTNLSTSLHSTGREPLRKPPPLFAGTGCITSARYGDSSPYSQVRQNVVQRKFAARAVILAFPTAVAGSYAMNCQNMPELTWHYGCFAAPGIIRVAVAACLPTLSGWAGCNSRPG